MPGYVVKAASLILARELLAAFGGKGKGAAFELAKDVISEAETAERVSAAKKEAREELKTARANRRKAERLLARIAKLAKKPEGHHG